MNSSPLYRSKSNLCITRKELLTVALSLAVFMLAGNYILYNFYRINSLKTVLRLGSMGLMLCVFLSKKSITMFQLLILAVAGFALLRGGAMGMNIAFIMIATVVLDADDKKFIRAVNVFSLLLAAVVVVSLLAGVVQTKTTDLGGRTRDTLGFVNVNAASLFFFSTGVIFLISREKIKWYHMAACIAGAYYLYTRTDTRTTFYGFAMFIAVYLLLEKFGAKWTTAPLVILEAAAYISPFLIRTLNERFPSLNETLSARPAVCISYMNANSYLNLLFGGGVGEVDNFFLMFLYNLGLVLYLLFGWLILRATVRLIRKGEATKVALILSILMIGLMESSALRGELLCMLLFWCFILKEIRVKVSAGQPMLGRQQENGPPKTDEESKGKQKGDGQDYR